MKKGNYYEQVFINCPLDDQYMKLFRVIVFAVLHCGFIPRCSLEITDATQPRLDTILKLIDYCKYGIHDLSRVALDQTTRLPRFNMPFELGLFYGAKIFGEKHHRLKSCMVFESKKYDYRKFISDLSGTDIKPHNYSNKEVIKCVRNWLASSSRRKNVPPWNYIYKRYEKFINYFRKKVCKFLDINPDSISFIESLTFDELKKNIIGWLKANS